MTTDVVTCGPDEPVGVVTRRMLRRDVRVLPVVDGDRLVGIVSRHDILRLFDRPDPEIRARVRALLADPLWAPEDHEVVAKVRDGLVTLSGTVRYESEVKVVASLVRGVPGVIEVVNRLTAREPDPRPVFARDTDWR